MNTKQKVKIAGSFFLLMLTGYANAQFSLYNYPPAPYSTNTTKPGFDLIFQDEFNSTTVNTNPTLNSQYWSVKDDPSCPNLVMFSNSQVGFTQVNPNSTDYALHIGIERYPSLQTITCPDGSTTSYQYKVGLVETKLQEFRYGYFEARCKMPDTRGAWPAFWLMGHEGYQPIDWQSCEIDIFENIQNTEDARLYTHNVHLYQEHNNCNKPNWHINGCNNNVGFMYNYMDYNNLNDDYHLYACEWTPTTMSFYLDNKLVTSYTLPAYAQQLANIPLWIIFNTSIDGNYDNYATGATQSTSPSSVDNMSNYLDVDYVRVYKHKPVLTSSSPECGTAFTVTASAGFSSFDTFDWTSITPQNCTFVSANGNSATFNRINSSQPATVHLKITDQATGKYAVGDYTFPQLNSEFTFAPGIGCSSSGRSITVNASSTTPGSQFQLWNTDANGNFTGTSLQSGFGSSYTFSGLTPGVTYAVTRGVWSTCTAWTFTQHNITIPLVDFVMTTPTCLGSGNRIAVQSTKSGTGSWNVYSCDANGNNTQLFYTSGTISINGSTWYTITGLNGGQHYKVVLSINAGLCTGNALASDSKVFFCPSVVLNDDITVTSNLISGGKIQMFCSGGYVSSTSQKYWELHQCNSTGGVINPTIIDFKNTNSTIFPSSSSYSLNQNTYYIAIYGVKDVCSAWQWNAALIYNTSVARMIGNDSSETIHIELPRSFADSMTALMLEKENTVQTSNAFDFSLAPNPSDNKTMVRLDFIPESATIEIYSYTGELIRMDIIRNKDQYELDCSQLNRGIYLVKITANDQVVTKKLVRN